MTTTQSGATESRPLEILGIGAAEESIYDWLLTHAGATVHEIARARAVTAGKVQRLLDAMASKGLVTHAPERPRRYIAAAPDIALKALALRRQEGLRRAEAEIQKLQRRAAAAQRRGEQEQIVELVTTRAAEAQILEQVQRAAQHEFVSLMRSPMRVSRLEDSSETDSRTQREAQARGVRYRSIVDAQYLELPGAVRRMRSDAEAGEEVRIFPGLPLKLVLADRRIGIIPLKLQDADGPSLIVRSSALLDAIYALFEMLWERAAPVSFGAFGAIEAGDAAALFSSEAEKLIDLMTTGLNDKRLADELDISMRTLRRRTVELMKSLNAHTRFQAGWIAASRRYGHKPL
ncbi:MAG TPA: helix-turn-helix domain-containing protein [Gammaproteobacteria bacterium]|nr:helix-turn-helix domain-containing protein [Gammaproteobacteria bacterium]